MDGTLEVNAGWDPNKNDGFHPKTQWKCPDKLDGHEDEYDVQKILFKLGPIFDIPETPQHKASC